MWRVVRTACVRYASKALQKDDEVKNAVALTTGDKAAVLAAVTEDGLLLRFASPELKADLDVARAAVTQTTEAVMYIGDSNGKWGLDFVGEEGEFISDPEDGPLFDKDILMIVLADNGAALMFFPTIIRDDTDVIRAAVGAAGSAIMAASDRLKVNAPGHCSLPGHVPALQTNACTFSPSRWSREYRCSLHALFFLLLLFPLYTCATNTEYRTTRRLYYSRSLRFRWR